MGRQSVRQKVILLGCVHLIIIITIAIAFPEDDRLEDAVHAAEKPHNEIQAKFNSESRAANLLATAVGCMDRCQSSMQAALKYSTKIHYGLFHSLFFPYR